MNVEGGATSTESLEVAALRRQAAYCPSSATGMHHWKRETIWYWNNRLSQNQRDSTQPQDWRGCVACNRQEYDPPKE